MRVTPRITVLAAVLLLGACAGPSETTQNAPEPVAVAEPGTPEECRPVADAAAEARLAEVSSEEGELAMMLAASATASTLDCGDVEQGCALDPVAIREADLRATWDAAYGACLAGTVAP